MGLFSIYTMKNLQKGPVLPNILDSARRVLGELANVNNGCLNRGSKQGQNEMSLYGSIRKHNWRLCVNILSLSGHLILKRPYVEKGFLA